MFAFPPPPPAGTTPEAESPFPIRYEDLTQDGRLVVDVIPSAYGEAVWRVLLGDHPVTHGIRRGVVPILSRLVVLGTSGPFTLAGRFEARGTFALAHGRDAGGAVDRIFMNLWTDVTGLVGRAHGPPPERDGERALAGRVFAEHVFTRPFGPAAARKVRSLEEVPGLPAVPDARYEPEPPDALLDAPPGASPLEPVLAPDGAAFVFGIGHTDTNQHVNSLVYPRLFEEAALRRLDALGVPARLLARGLDVTFRKPSFAGDRVRIVLRAYRDEARYLVTAALVGDDEAAAFAASPGAVRARAYARLSLEA